MPATTIDTSALDTAVAQLKSDVNQQQANYAALATAQANSTAAQNALTAAQAAVDTGAQTLTADEQAVQSQVQSLIASLSQPSA